jgi:hypothetical protein
LLKQLYRARQGRLGDTAPFGRTREIEVVAYGQELASLMKLHIGSTFLSLGFSKQLKTSLILNQMV